MSASGVGGKPHLVVVGAGMATVRLLEELVGMAPGRYAITVFGDEPCLPYNRVLLTPVLAGDLQHDGIVLRSADWYRANGITLRSGIAVTAIDRAARRVSTADGASAAYDRLVIATGSCPVRLPLPGADAPGVWTYRDARDTDALIAAAGPGRRAVVIGGGLLGIEAAAGLAARGASVTVVHLMPWLMERQVDADGGALIANRLRMRGIDVKLETQTRAVCTDAAGRAAGVVLADGTTLPADLVVMAIGVRPNVALAQAAGLHCRRAIVVSDTLQTFDPRIYAIGECAEHRGVVYGLVAPLHQMARVCAAQLAGIAVGGYRGSVLETRLKVSGIEVYSCGEFAADSATESIVCTDGPLGLYRRVVLRDGRVVGAVLVGDAADAAWLSGLVVRHTDVAAIRDALAFGPEAAGAIEARAGGADRAGTVAATDSAALARAA